MSDTEAPAGTRASLAGTASYVLAAAGLLFAFRHHLAWGLIAGLLVHSVLQRVARLLRGPRLSHGAAKVVSLALAGLVAGGAVVGGLLLLVGFVRGRVGDLPLVFAKMAEALDSARSGLDRLGFSNVLLPEVADDAAAIKSAAVEWLQAHATELKSFGAEAGRALVHVLMGVVVGLLVFFRHHESVPDRPLARALHDRISLFVASFDDVVSAQIWISALNTALTAVYLLGILPLLGRPLPLAGTLVVVTFVAGLVPVVGNLISNTVIVLISLGVSPWVAAGSLAFLVLVHKLEYFANAKIVGSKIAADAWEILLAIIVFETAFGVPGVILAPVIYAWVKRELKASALV